MPYAAESVLLTAAREAKKIWPALVGLGTVGFAVVKVTAAATPEARAHTQPLAQLSHVARSRAA
jgi:predicted lysophospholipase L1 biosynthesis ABC-type transport system permease subunit